MQEELVDSDRSHRSSRWGYIFMLLTSSVFFGCAASTWDRLDPEYDALLPTTRTDPQENAIIGIWHTETQDRFGHPSSRHTLLIKPDHTVYWRSDGKEGAEGEWKYNGRGVWTVIWSRNTFRNAAVGQFWLPVTMRYTGRFLLVDAPFNGGAWSMGGVISNQLVYVSADDETGVRNALRKRF